MRSFATRLVLSVSLGCMPVSPSWACINDIDTYREEQKFKSLYPDAPSYPSSDPGGMGYRGMLANGAAGVGGIAILGLAGYLSITRKIG